MSTCKECLHFEVCGGFTPTDLDADAFDYCRKGNTDEIPDVEERCGSFKNKADYMQIRNPKYKTMKIPPIKIHGKWVKDRNKRTCSICGFLYLENGKTTFNFCPNCGTNMKGGVE